MMNSLINFALVVLTYFFMEFVAWSNHKYVMHGFLWKWHKDHHRMDQGKSHPEKTKEQRFEKNDLFFIIYALPAGVLLIAGFSVNYMPMVYIGVGITLYGFTYFVIHDVIIHRRINVPFLQTNHNRFIMAVVNAHNAHHKPKSINDFRNYGLLIFPLRFFKS